MQRGRKLSPEEIHRIVMKKQELRTVDGYVVCAVVFQVAVGRTAEVQTMQAEAREQLERMLADFSDFQREMVWNEALRSLEKLKEQQIISPEARQTAALCPKFFITPDSPVEPLQHP